MKKILLENAARTREFWTVYAACAAQLTTPSLARLKGALTAYTDSLHRLAKYCEDQDGVALGRQGWHRPHLTGSLAAQGLAAGRAFDLLSARLTHLKLITRFLADDEAGADIAAMAEALRAGGAQ
ncbi:MAG: hypothetical protein KA204_04140 [Chromatiaceae bacterium]|nr:hypothetical protein [Chromatiaceae bacterium]MBP6582648.1 hypothetical protein [Chromatiaceae bacterium]MBP8197120.1 hypothetical protein [Chromatiaceae bacterium]MBP8282562.1 hypothetical protein [Chromatiaceae bacterium]